MHNRQRSGTAIATLLLAGSAFATAAGSQGSAASPQPRIVVAQSAAPAGDSDQDKNKGKRPPAPGQTPKAAPSTTPRGQQPPAAQQQQHPPSAPSTAQQPPKPPTPPTAQQPKPPAAPSTAQQPPKPPTPPTAQQPHPQNTPPTAQQPPRGPAAAGTPASAGSTTPAARTVAPAAVPPPPTQTRNANEFIRRGGQQAGPRIDQLRQERHEVREGNRTFIREGDRTIIREGDRNIISHNEASRFAISARDVRVERRGANTETIVVRPDGVRIVNITDPEGHLIRRLRRDASGRDIVIIDNSFAGPRAATLFVQLPPPVIRIPREHYIVEAGHARREDIYEVFLAPPVERIEHPYTLDQVRFSLPLRERMPRVDLDINFDTGSWQLTPEEVDKLALVAEGLNRAIQRNPGEVFMIEGHTDAVGNDVDNLSLSDRRAEAVAVALTEQFQVPPENLVTQGYGEQYLKVPTQGSERANRRVAALRITPLIDQQAANAPR